ncbi:sugar ABC transporter permease [Paenibacillus oenotherae]|uniref:Maltose/maltodextrin transport system permease protein n=1 Tax=Paenibacillus oenotherae TaxID=1435645 RepID=A0ABS7D234_9BACL|nr:sugar ABC transporter permease [Paenibacillus oenotherae]MBW7473904.1 sugar ABC transporter permease [Paenibacillus oenotherae]
MKRYSKTAVILSLLCMGLGQLYNRQFMKGIVFLAIHMVGLYYSILYVPGAVRGLLTLGDHAARMELVGKIYQHLAGDHSIYLMIEGLIILALAVIYLGIYLLNIKDAHDAGRIRESGKSIHTFRQDMYALLDRKFAYLLLALPAAGILIFTVMPIIFMILLAFTNYSAPDHIPPAKLVDWTGFQSFIDLLQLKTWSKTFYGVLIWTIIWAVLSTITTYFSGILIALLIQRKGIRFKTMWRTILILPYAIPQIISLLVMRNLFNGQFGPINQYLSYFGLGKLPWLSDPVWAKATVIAVNMWIGMPLTMVLMMGVLSTIPKEFYEAAEVDGATGLQRFRFITLPMILFSTAPILIIQFAGNFNNFNVIYLMTNGNPVQPDYQYAGSTDLLVTWLYKLTLESSKFSTASAIGIIIFLIIASLSIGSYRRSRSFREEDMFQ